MRPEIKAKWTAELRSGKYEQGNNALNRSGRLCCLGVLCEVAVAEGVVDRFDFSDTEVSYGTDGEEAIAVLPHAVRNWAGLEDNNPFITVKGKTAVASAHNDVFGRTFDEIADGIDASL